MKKRILASVLSLSLLFQMVSVSAFANNTVDTKPSDTQNITSFEELAEDVKVQTLEVGAEETPNLPETIKATQTTTTWEEVVTPASSESSTPLPTSGEGDTSLPTSSTATPSGSATPSDADKTDEYNTEKDTVTYKPTTVEEVVEVDVNWVLGGETAFSTEKAGEFIYTAELKDATYTVADSVSLPTITAKVVMPEMQTFSGFIAPKSGVTPASGDGTSSSPRIVHNFDQLKEALESTDTNLVYVTLGDGSTAVVDNATAEIQIAGTKTLTLAGSGTNQFRFTGESGANNLFVVGSGADFTINVVLNQELVFTPYSTGGAVVKVNYGTFATNVHLEGRVPVTGAGNSYAVNASGGTLDFENVVLQGNSNASGTDATAINLSDNATATFAGGVSVTAVNTENKSDRVALVVESGSTVNFDNSVTNSQILLQDYAVADADKDGLVLFVNDGNSYLSNVTRTVTVTGGTANVSSANYGQVVTVTATGSSTFGEWRSNDVTFVDNKAPETTFIMDSNPVSVTAIPKREKPIGTFVATGYDTGTLTITSDLYTSESDASGGVFVNMGNARITSNPQNLSGLNVGTLQVYLKGDNTTHINSDYLEFTIGRATKPTPTAGEGKITDVDNTMEYRKVGTSTWEDVVGSEITSLTAGTYEVRVKASGHILASDSAEVTVGLTKNPTPNATFEATSDSTGTLTFTTSGNYLVNGRAISGTTANVVGLTGGSTITIIHRGNGTTTSDSDPQTITVIQAATPTGITESGGTLSGLTTAMEYSSDYGATWTDVPSADFNPGSANTYRVRVKANNDVLASDYVEVTTGGTPATKPTASFKATGDDSGIITITGDYNDVWTNWSNTKFSSGTLEITYGLYDGFELIVYRKGDGTTTINSEPVTFNITQATKPTTPTGGIAKITGLDSDMEYRKVGGSPAWTPVSLGVTEVSVDAGTYYVRAKVDGEVLASAPKEVTVTATTYSATVSPTTLDFGSAVYGYSTQDVKTVTITNTGSGDITGLRVTAPASSSFEIVTAINPTTIASGGTATFTVRPQNGLTAGEWISHLVIGNDSGAYIDNVSLQFKVTEATTYSAKVSPTALNFGIVEYGYGEQPAKEVTITNTGTGAISGLSVTAPTGYVISTGLSTTTLPSNGDTATFSIKPETGLGEGTHNITLTIGNGSGVTIDNVNLEFEVSNPTYSNIVSPTTLNFGTVEYGYLTAPTAQEVTITNNGTGDITGFSATIPTGYELVGSTPNATITANGGKVTFSVRPETGLDAGNRDATISFANASGATIDDVSLRFVVTKDKKDPPNVTFTATGTDTGELTGSSLANLSYTINDSTGIGSNVPSTGILTDTLANGDIIRVYTKGDETNIDHSDAQVIYVTQAYLPSGINKTDATLAGNDGSITGVSAAMEYSDDDGATWKPITGTSLTGLSADTYLVRVKANGTALASESVSLTIDSKTIEYATGIHIGNQEYQLSTNSNNTNPALPSGLSWDYQTKTIYMHNYNGTAAFDVGSNDYLNLHIKGINSITVDQTVDMTTLNDAALELSNAVITADAGAKLTITVPANVSGSALYRYGIKALHLQILGGTIEVFQNSDISYDSGIRADNLVVGGDANLKVVADGTASAFRGIYSANSIILSTSGKVDVTSTASLAIQAASGNIEILGKGTYKGSSGGSFSAFSDNVVVNLANYDVTEPPSSTQKIKQYAYKTGSTLPTVSSVTVNTDATTFEIKKEYDFTATVNGTNNPSQEVIWSIYGQSGTTYINATTGRLTITTDEESPKITVVATSVQDMTVQGIKTIEITGITAPPPAALTATVHINGLPRVNETLQAVVNATNNTGVLQYEWYHSATNTLLGTGDTYLVKPADLGKALVVKVSSTIQTGEIQRHTATIQAATAPPAPTELGVKAPTASGGDGKITGTDATMEYATNSAFTDAKIATATETSVAPGTYYVRFKANGGVDASAYISVTVPNYTAPISYSAKVSPDGKVFTSAEVGYGPQTAQLFTILNDGTANLANVNVTISGTDFTLTTTGMATSLVPTASTTFSVVPNGSLSEGKHTATITISADSMTDITKTVSFTVTAKAPVNAVTGVSINGDPIVNVDKGTTDTFTAVVSGTGSYDSTVTWSILTSGVHTGTTINASTGLLTISGSETKTTIVVQAKANGDASKTDTVTVNVTDPGKTDQTLSFADGNAVTKIKGTDTTYKNVLNGAKTTVTYISGNEAVATVANDGTVTIVGAGTTIIIANAKAEKVGGVDYNQATASYTLTVNAGTISLATDAVTTFDIDYADLDKVILRINSTDYELTRHSDKQLSGYTPYTFNGGKLGKEASGSVIITLYKEFLATLPAGTTYSVAVTTTGGTTAGTTTATIPAKSDYTLTINANGATGTTASGTYEEGTIVSITAGTRSGYTFNGWSGSGVTFTNANSATTQMQMPSANTTITANWSRNSTGSSGGSSTTYYDIEIEVEGMGEVNPDGGSDDVERVKRNSDKKFTFTADEGYMIVDVLVDGKSMGAIESYTFEEVKEDHTLKVVFEMKDDDTGSGTGAKNPFIDVKSSDWFYEDVMYVYEEGIMSGVTKNTFAPTDNATRAMIWTVLARLSGADLATTEMWYESAQKWSIENEVSDGTNPNGYITREQLVTMLFRYNNDPAMTLQTMLEQFEDSEMISEYAVSAMEWAVAKGIINGKGEMLDPQGNATRAEIAAIMHRFMTVE